MKLKIQELLKELMSYTNIPNDYSSAEIWEPIRLMHQEFEKLESNVIQEKQKKMITLFMGGIVHALTNEDKKHRTMYYWGNDVQLGLSDQIYKQGNFSFKESCDFLAEKILSTLPYSFNAEIFQLEHEITVPNSPEVPLDQIQKVKKIKVHLFPELYKHRDKITLLVDFCRCYPQDLERLEVDMDELTVLKKAEDGTLEKQRKDRKEKAELEKLKKEREAKKEEIVYLLKKYGFKLTDADQKKLEHDDNIIVSNYLDNYLLNEVQSLYENRQKDGLFKPLVILAYQGKVSTVILDKIWSLLPEQTQMYYATCKFDEHPLTTALLHNNLAAIKSLDSVCFQSINKNPDYYFNFLYDLTEALKKRADTEEKVECFKYLLGMAKKHSESQVVGKQGLSNQTLPVDISSFFIQRIPSTLLQYYCQLAKYYTEECRGFALETLCRYLVNNQMTQGEYTTLKEIISTTLTKMQQTKANELPKNFNQFKEEIPGFLANLDQRKQKLAEKAEQEKAAQEKAAQEKAAQEKAAQEKAAQEKAGQEKAAQEKAAQEKAAREKAAQEKAAREKAAQEKAAQEKAGQEKAAQEKAAQEKAAQEKAAREKAAQEKAAQEKAGQEKAAQEKAAQEKAAQEKAAREKAAQEKAAQEKAAQEKAAQEKAAQEKAAREKAAREKAAQEKAAQEKAAQEKAAREKAAREKAAQGKAAQEKAEKERAQQQEKEKTKLTQRASDPHPPADVTTQTKTEKPKKIRDVVRKAALAKPTKKSAGANEGTSQQPTLSGITAKPVGATEGTAQDPAQPEVLNTPPSTKLTQQEKNETLEQQDTEEVLNFKKTLKAELAAHEKNCEALLIQLKIAMDSLNTEAQENSNYTIIATHVTTVYHTLNTEIRAFFKNPSASKFETCQEHCATAMKTALKESENHRGWHAVSPILRGILGVLAALSLIPALVVAAKYGYNKTFFETPETTTSKTMKELQALFEAQEEDITKTLKNEAPKL